MKESSRQRITRCLEQLDAWRVSGLPIEAYAQSLGQSVAQWRAWVSWESRWRRMLNTQSVGVPDSKLGFVKVSPTGYARKVKATQQPGLAPAAKFVDNNVVLVLTRLGSGVSVRVHWPLHAMAGSGVWLREVLA
jgi:hypothetical protein